MTTPRTRPESSTPALDLVKVAAAAADAKKAEDIVGLDMRKLEGVTDFFFICSGSSEPQVKAIAEHIEDQLRALGRKPWHTEGYDSRRWILLDYVDFVVHVFHEKTREYYLLERLWGDAGRVDLGLG